MKKILRALAITSSVTILLLPFAFATPEYTKKENKACVFCHTAVGKPDLNAFGFDIGDARISLGLVISALIRFVVVAFILFLIIRFYNKFRDHGKAEEEKAETELTVLRDIRESLRNR